MAYSTSVIVLLSFSKSSARKCVFLSNEPCKTRPTIIDLNSIDLNNYPFIISLGKCNGICNAADDLSTKICVSNEKKDINVKVLNMITRINKAKTFVKHSSCDCKCKFVSTTSQKWNNDKCHASVKSIVRAQKFIIGILGHVFVKRVSI